MTESEAIEKLKNMRLYMQIEDESNDCKFTEDDYKANEMAIQALEKQIPKKPHKNFEKFSGVWCSCGKYLGKGYFVDKPSYCPDCGQKLDWSDKE